MEKGFDPRLSRPLAGAVLAACLFSSSALTAQHPAPWWKILLEITATGKYAMNGGEAPVTGDYVCRVLWEGRLDPDDDDFLLVHLRTEVLEWRLRERSGPAGGESVLEAPAAPGPTVRMTYVLKDGRDVEFVFDLGGISIPLHASPLSVALELPRSPGRTSGGRGKAYGDFVGRGSSRIVIPESDFEQRSPKRRFSWDWRREKQYVRNGRVLNVTQSHDAEAVVTVTVR